MSAYPWGFGDIICLLQRGFARCELASGVSRAAMRHPLDRRAEALVVGSLSRPLRIGITALVGPITCLRLPVRARKLIHSRAWISASGGASLLLAMACWRSVGRPERYDSVLVDRERVRAAARALDVEIGHWR